MSGVAWLVEAHGCDPAMLADLAVARRLVDHIVADLGLTPIGGARWHRHAAHHGISGLVLLSDAHLALHGWPEHGTLCLDLFCARPRPAWDFEAGLRALVGAARVDVRRVTRALASAGDGPGDAGVLGGELEGLPGVVLPP